MSHDQQTYRRAASAALIGLTIQLLLAILTGLTGLYAGSIAVHAITWHIVGGLPIWVALWLIYNQHRLERIEALETEQLAAEDAQAAALFEEAGQQLQLARKRLNNLYKYGLGIVSLIVGLYLLIVGGGMLYHGLGLESDQLLEASFDAQRNAGVIVILAFAIGFIGFLVSRYVSGMTQIKEWQLLRGGAGYLMGNVCVTVLLIAAAVAGAMSNYTLFPILAIAAPAVMVLLGLETLLSLIFGFYQPRRPDQTPRPAFDSRILGWLTRPESLGKIVGEAINYQFGFEISASWFYRMLSNWFPRLIVVGLLVLLGMTSVVIVAPHQRAVVTRLNKLTPDSVAGPGLHWKLPWPLGRADKYDAFRVHELRVGSSADDFDTDVAVLWTTQHAGDAEQYMVTAPSRHVDAQDVGVDVGVDAAAGELAGGLGIIKYRIADDGLLDYTLSADDPVKLLEAMADRRFNAYFASHDIDTLLTSARVKAGETLRAQLQGDADAFHLGVEIVYVGLEAIHPPREGEVAEKFHEQIDARQEKQTEIQDAHRRAVSALAQVAGSRDKALRIDAAIQEVVALQQSLEAMRQSDDGYDPAKADQLADEINRKKAGIEQLMDNAGGEASKLIYEARAYRWEYALNERARAMRTASRFYAYQQAPRYYKVREYLNVLAEGLAKRRKIILIGLDEQDVPPMIRIEAQTTTSNLQGIGIE